MKSEVALESSSGVKKRQWKKKFCRTNEGLRLFVLIDFGNQDICVPPPGYF